MKKKCNTLHNSFNGKTTAMWACGELTCDETEELLLSNNLTRFPNGHLVAQCRHMLPSQRQPNHGMGPTNIQLAMGDHVPDRGPFSQGPEVPSHALSFSLSPFSIHPLLPLFHSFSVATFLLFFSHHSVLVPLHCCGSLCPSLSFSLRCQ